MSEQGMRQRVINALRKLDAVSVENPAYPGTPDVNFIEGWIELKWLRSWPVRKDTAVTIDHLTQQQRVWLLRRWGAGGNAWLLLQCGREWLLFDGNTAFHFVGRVNRGRLIELARRYWKDGLNDEELQLAIKR